MEHHNLTPRIPALALATALLCAAGCASNQVRVESDPAGADIYLVGANQMATKIAKTPATLDDVTAAGAFSTDVQVRIVKEGFESESIWIPKTSMGLRASYFAKLRENAIEKACSNQIESLSNLAKGVAEAQNSLFRKDYDQAERQLKSLTERFTTVAILYDLLGNLYYLRKDLERALEAYKLSAKIQPGKTETDRMIQKINAIRGKSTERRP